MKEFYVDCDGVKLHAKLDRPDGVERGPLCILIHGFIGHMEEDLCSVEPSKRVSAIAEVGNAFKNRGEFEGF